MEAEHPELMVRTYSEEETIILAKRLGQLLTDSEVILISGELGAGKTVFVRGLAVGLGIKEENLVCSPSFTLINIYQGKVRLYHIDLYRLERPEEIDELGLEDYLGTGVVAIEWAEKLPFEIKGLKVLKVIIEVGKNEERRIKISCSGNCPEINWMVINFNKKFI